MCGRIQHTKAPIVEPNMDLEIATEGLQKFEGEIGKGYRDEEEGEEDYHIPINVFPQIS
jgi:hypothetical protein